MGCGNPDPGHLRRDARACFAAALAAADPTRLVRSALTRAGWAAASPGPVLLLGAGKAALAMARAATELVGDRLRGGVVIVPHGAGGTCPGVDVLTGAHPVPDERGVAATARLLALAEGAGPTTVVLVVLSGGASALLVAPAPGITLADKQHLTQRLLAAGADVAALNTVRRHCSRVKGGGLARAAAGAKGLVALVLSDVVGDDLATIASGPTVPDPTTSADAAAVLGRFLAPDEVPPTVQAHVRRGCAGVVPDTLDPDDPLLARTRTFLVGSNRDAVDAAVAHAARLGFDVTRVPEPIVGDAAAAGRLLAERLGALPRDRAVALVAGGETTVRVVPGGRGGRSQHLALAAAAVLAGTPAVLLAAGTDGVDGPTDAAGACVDGETVARARAAGHDPVAALRATDSHPLLAATGDLVVIGPTGTNVADVVVALRVAC